MDNWIEKNIRIKEIKHLIDDYDIEVDSPDGWVEVDEYIEKGKKIKWELIINDKILNSSKNHLYETNNGWKFACELDNMIGDKILCDDNKYHDFSLRKTNDYINVVDISVNHKNHRYYTNGVSSHNTNLGKTLIKCGLAVNALLQNKNVLYVTLEMSEEKISERLLANLFDIEMDNLPLMSKEKFCDRLKQIKDKVGKKLVIKEFPTKSISTNNIRNLLKELKMKKGFVPDICFVDYIGIMNPCIMRKEENSYTEVKRISEELRGLAVETGVPWISGIQTNRGGFSNAEIDLTDVADSIGSTATADLIVGVTQSEDYRHAGKYLFIILKNRYGLNKMKSTVEVTYSKMRIYQNKEDAKPEKLGIVDEAAVQVINNLNKDKKSKQKRIIDFN